MGENLQPERADGSGFAELFLGGGVGVCSFKDRKSLRSACPPRVLYSVLSRPVPPDLALQWDEYELTLASRRAWFNGFRV